MRLYYFTTERYGLEAIRDSRLKIARINELNDPFEFLGLSLLRQDRRKLMRMKNQMADQFGLVCMSRSWKHPLLWGHYADKHRGLCLGFDVSNGLCKKVKYRPNRPTLKEFGYGCLDELDEPAMLDLLYTKFDAWAYESEYRIFCGLEERDQVHGHYFLPFSEGLKLARVSVGARSSVTRQQLADKLGKRFKSVSAFKVRAGFTEFEVVRNKLEKAWR